MKTNESGRTLVEVLLVTAILGTGVVTAVPALRAYSEESHIVGYGPAAQSTWIHRPRSSVLLQ